MVKIIWTTLSIKKGTIVFSGLKNVYIYGWIIRWLLLQDIYGNEKPLQQ